MEPYISLICLVTLLTVIKMHLFLTIFKTALTREVLRKENITLTCHVLSHSISLGN